MISFIWIGYVSALSVFTGLCLIAAAIAAEAHLVKQKKKKAAVILIAAVLILGTGSSIFFSIVRELVSAGPRSDIYLYRDSERYEGVIGKFQVITDSHDQIQGFGKLAVKTDGGIEYMDLEFDEQHRMIGEKKALKYSSMLEDSLKAEWMKNTLTGKSVSVEALDKIGESYESETVYFDKSQFPRAFLLSNLLTLVLIFIYLAGKIREKRKKASGLDSTKIQDL